MPNNRKEFPKKARTIKIDYIINCAIVDFAKKTDRTEISIIEEALTDFFKGREDIESFRIIADNLTEILEQVQGVHTKLDNLTV